MSIRLDIGARLRDGRQIARANYKQADVAKLGILRAGNTGIMSADGQFAGSCPRVTHLRQLGIEVDIPDDPTLIMFQVGTANEDIVYNDLIQTAQSNEVILREEEIPIEWFTTNGTKVTGRPDMVICEREQGPPAGEWGGWYPISKKGLGTIGAAKPVLMLELKSVASIWTARKVFFDLQPKVANLAQAGHYMWKLGVPGRLMYKQYAIQAVSEEAARYLPYKGAPRSEFIEYDDSTHKPRTVRPFEITYELEFSTLGVLRYRPEGSHVWVDSCVTSQDIERYYEFVSKMEQSGDLGDRPLAVKPNGDEYSYKLCKYCKLWDICKTRKKLAYADFIAQAKQMVIQIAENKTKVNTESTDK